MKKLKLLFIVCLLSAFDVTQAQTTIASGYCGGEGDSTNLTWTLTNDSTLTISGSGAMKNYSGYYEGGYGDYMYDSPWYNYIDTIKTVFIGDSVTSIGNNAFQDCVALTSVNIGNSVIRIGDGAFQDCVTLTSVTIPNSVTCIESEAFSTCSGLISVNIGNSVTKIGSEAFAGCINLTSITIPSSVTKLGDGEIYDKENSALSVFISSSNLTEINVEKDNLYYSSVAGILHNKTEDTLLVCPIGKSGKIIISSKVKVIHNTAFMQCYRLTSIIIPNSVTTIGWGTFQDCRGLTSIILPNSVTSIGDYAFAYCRSLVSVTIPNSVTSIGTGVFGFDDLNESLDTIRVFWKTPIVVQSDAFGDMDITKRNLIIPYGTMSAYQNADVWQDFILVEAAPEVETEITTTENSVTVEWEQVTDAFEYVLTVYNNGEQVASIHFDANGNVIVKTEGKWASKASNFIYNLDGLSSGTTYTYTLTAYNEQEEVVAETQGDFTTLGGNVAVEQSSVVANILRVYPNPTKNDIVISPTTIGDKIEIYNAVGNRVLLVVANAEQTILSLQSLPTGIYFVKIDNKTIKVVKK